MARRQMTVEQILQVLQETPGRLLALAGSATAEQLAARPAPEEWSAVEILAHLRSCADMWGGAIERILGEDHPTIRAVNPTTWIESTDYRELDFATSLRAFCEQRSPLLARLRDLPAEGWSRAATVLGGGKPWELTVHAYANRLARHERPHARQAERALAGILA